MLLFPLFMLMVSPQYYKLETQSSYRNFQRKILNANKIKVNPLSTNLAFIQVKRRQMLLIRIQLNKLLLYQMNDLRLLQQVDPNKKVIALQFKQINALQPMMPLLSKFENLQSLSLHGNRLKSLPKDMSALTSLAELDISNNLFLDINDLAESLISIPSLTHLIMNFKSQQEENFIRNSLPRLERINKKPISSHKSDFNYTQKKNHQVHRLNEADLENIGLLYDEIRQIYKNSKYFVDKQLADDFDRNVENIMSELEHKIKGNESQVQKNCNILCGKYALIDLCFVKLITYFYHFDKKIAGTFEKIHDEQADMFKSLTDLLYAEAMRSKIEITQVRTQKEQLYRAQIKRLKAYQEQTLKQIEYLQMKNKQYLEKLMKYGKSNVFENSINKILNTRPQSRSPGKNSNRSDNMRESHAMVTVKNKPKILSLNQLKQIIYQIYESKLKHNQFCIENSQSFETMESHMYTFLNQKYGLKSLAIEWAMSIVNGIKKYGMDDPEVATFGKILRNQVEQQFLGQLLKIKQNFNQNYQRFKRNLTQGLDNPEISINQSEQILLFLHLKRQQINQIISRIKDDKLVNNLVTKQKLQRSLLEYYVRRHDQKIFELHKEFKAVDDDEDGIIDIYQLQNLMKVINPNIDIEKLVQLLDPSKKGVIIYSYLCEIILKHPDFKDYFKQSD